MEAGALRAPATLNRISVTAPLLRLRSDEQLVALFRAGNDAAFGVIHDRYRQRLFAYARQMLGGSRQDAEDALQDVFLRAYSSLRATDKPLSLRAWLYRVAHNRCVDHLRRPAPAAVDLFETSRKPLHDPIAEAERREDLRRLIEDVRRLPDQQRSALLMREIDGLTYAELAEVLDVSVQAVKSLLVRARIGLVEAAEARETACAEIRSDLVDAFERGVRASGRARRHLRDCRGCVEYRAQLRTARDGLAALAPAGGPLSALLKLAGIGGASSAGAASAGGGALVAAGGGTAAKVAAVVCCAALATGGAEVVNETLVKHGTRGSSAQATPSAPAVEQRAPDAPPARHAGAAGDATRPASAAPATTVRDRGREEHRAGFVRGADPLSGGGALSAPAGAAVRDSQHADAVTGGAGAPDEETGFADTTATATGSAGDGAAATAIKPVDAATDDDGQNAAGGLAAPADDSEPTASAATVAATGAAVPAP